MVTSSGHRAEVAEGVQGPAVASHCGWPGPGRVPKGSSPWRCRRRPGAAGLFASDQLLVPLHKCRIFETIMIGTGKRTWQGDMGTMQQRPGLGRVHDGQRHSSWNTLAALISAVAAMITALVAFLAFVVGGDKRAQPSPSKSSARGSGSSQASVSPKEPSHAAPHIAWQGEFLFDNDGVDLDGEPPNPYAWGRF